MRAVNEIPLPQASRLHDQSEKPFESVFAHPHRGSRDAPSMKIKRGADADQHRNAEKFPVFEHPSILLRRAKTNPYDVSARTLDGFHDLAIFLQCQRAKRRAIRSCNNQARESRREARREVSGDFRGSSIKEMAISLGCRLFAKFSHQLRATHTAPKGETFPPAHPHQWKTVRNHEVGARQHALETLVVLRLHDAAHVRNGHNVACIAPTDPLLHPCNRVRYLHCIHSHAQQVVTPDDVLVSNNAVGHWFTPIASPPDLFPQEGISCDDCRASSWTCAAPGATSEGTSCSFSASPTTSIPACPESVNSTSSRNSRGRLATTTRTLDSMHPSGLTTLVGNEKGEQAGNGTGVVVL